MADGLEQARRQLFGLRHVYPTLRVSNLTDAAALNGKPKTSRDWRKGGCGELGCLNARGGEGGVRLPLLAPLRHTGGPTTCLLIGVVRTWPAPGQNVAIDPKPDIALF